MGKVVEEVQSIAGVATYIRRTGEGPPVLVVHGGPGFNQDYLHRMAAPLEGHRTVVFYDQPGCGRSHLDRPADAALTFRHFAELVDRLFPDGELGLIAHSWGVVVALGGAASGMRRKAFGEGLLVAPVPVTRAGYDAASANLFSRIPPQAQQRYLELAGQGRSADVVSLMLPFYFAKPIPPERVGLTIDIATFATVTASLGDFDFRAQLPVLAACDALTTGGDFCTPDLSRDLLNAVAHRHFLNGIGHFPAHEAPQETAAIVATAFSRGRS